MNPARRKSTYTVCIIINFIGSQLSCIEYKSELRYTALYTKLDAQCDQQAMHHRSTVDNTWPPSQSVINNLPTTYACLSQLATMHGPQLEFCNGNRTLRNSNQDISDPKHFGTILVGLNRPDSSALMPKGRSDLSAELSSPSAEVSRPISADCGRLYCFDQ